MYNSMDSIKSCIQEWFADADDAAEVARTYHEILMESDKQMEYMMEQFTGKNN